MALVMTKTFKSGITVNNCYFKISNISGNKDKLYITVEAYINREASLSETPFIEQTQYNFVPDQSEESLRWDKQGYEFLKLQPEFKAAEDVLDD